MKLTENQKQLLDFDKRIPVKRIKNLPQSTLQARRAIEARGEQKKLEEYYEL